VFGEVATIGGLILAYELDVAPGGVIVLLAVLILAVVMLAERFGLARKKEVRYEGN
jgi:zinc transport system permease protein